MMKMLFKAYNYVIETDFDLQLPFANARSIPDVVFREGVVSSKKTKRTKIYRNNIVAQSAISDDVLVLDWQDIGCFQCQNNQITYQKKTPNEDIFRLFAISEVLGLFLLQKGVFLLHGSAVKIGEEASVFIGKSGAGKSTTVAAFAKAEFTVLSDDMTAIVFDENDIPFILPAYPVIKIWEESVLNLGFDKKKLNPAFEGHNKYILRQSTDKFPQSAIRLKEINILQKPNSSKNTIIEKSNIPIELVKYFPLPHHFLTQKYLHNHFRDTLKIASLIPVKNMKRPRSFQSLNELIISY